MIEEIIDSKVKAFVVFIFSAISLGLFAVSTQFAVLVFKEWHGFATGIALMILAIPFHAAAKKINVLYLYSIALNSIANGFVVSTYYVKKNIPVNIIELLIALAPAIGILFLVYLCLQVYSKTKRFAVTIAVVLLILLMIGEVVLWVKTGSVIFSFGFFGLIIALFYLCVFGVTINHDERAVLRDISFGCFGSVVILAVVVAVILSEGEFLEGADFAPSGSSKKNRKNTGV